MSSPICIERSGVSSSITAEFLNKSIRFENTFLSLKQETLESTSKPIKQGQSNPNYCSINQASNSEYNSVPTVRNTSLKSNSRILSIDLTNTNPKVSIPNCKSPNDDNTKRKLLVASSPKPQTPDRSRIGAEMNYSRRDVMEKTQSYFGDTSSIGNNSSLIRAEDFQIKLKDELKKIEQRYKNGLGNNQIGVSFIASSEANHQNASILSNAGLNVKKEFGDILGNWKEVNGIRVEETARNKKIEQIKMLIQDKPLGRGVEVSEKNEMEEQAKLRKKAKLNKIQENLDKIEVEIIPFDIVSNKETIDYNLSDNEGSLSRRDSRSQSVKKQDDVPRVITPLETAKDENIFIDRSSRRKEEKDHSCKEERTRNKELPIPQKKDRTPVSAYQDKKKSQKENQIQKEKIMRNLLIESFLVLFEKKFDLVSRVRRRSYFKLIFYTIKQKHQIQLEKERNNHSHEILKMIAEEYLIQTSARLRNFITDMRCIKIEGEEEEVDDEEIHSGEEERNSDREIVYEGEEEYSDKGGEEGGQNRDLIEQIEDNDQIRGNEDVENDQEDVRQIESEEKVGEEKEMRENDDVEENLNQGAESPTNNVQIPSTRLDEFRVRRLLIIAKTIIFQKLYISNHEFFTKFKTKSERLKKRRSS